MRNVKGIIEANFDMQPVNTEPNFVGHRTKEGYLLVGLDAAF